MAVRKYDHTHKYEKTPMGKKGHEVYKCMIANCSHFLPTMEMAINAVSQCWGGCGGDVIITKEMVQQRVKKPRCPECRAELKRQREAMGSSIFKSNEEKERERELELKDA